MECRGGRSALRPIVSRGRLGVRGFGTRADIGRIPISRQNEGEVVAPRMLRGVPTLPNEWHCERQLVGRRRAQRPLTGLPGPTVVRFGAAGNVPNRFKVDYISSTSIGLFEQTAAQYGEIWYDLGGHKTMSRLTTAEGVLETIYTLANITPPSENDRCSGILFNVKPNGDWRRFVITTPRTIFMAKERRDAPCLTLLEAAPNPRRSRRPDGLGSWYPQSDRHQPAGARIACASGHQTRQRGPLVRRSPHPD